MRRTIFRFPIEANIILDRITNLTHCLPLRVVSISNTSKDSLLNSLEQHNPESTTFKMKVKTLESEAAIFFFLVKSRG